MSIPDLLERIKLLKWLIVNFISTDGTLRTVTISSDQITEKSFVEGLNVDVLKYFYNEELDLKFLFKNDSFFVLPWADNTGSILAKINDKGRYLKDPMLPVERIKLNLKAVGIDEIFIKPTFSFNLFTNVNIDVKNKNRFLVNIDGKEGDWNPDNLNREPDYLNVYPFDFYAGMRSQIAETLESTLNKKILLHYHGVDPNQHVLTFEHMPLENASDHFVLSRYLIRAFGLLNMYIASFMPMPFLGGKGNFFEFELDLKKDGRSLLFEDGKLTDAGHYFVGGIIEHMESLLIFTNPTTNSYKRLNVNKFYTSYGVEGSNHAIYISNNKLVFKFLDPSINPYFAYASILAAGLDGVKNKIDKGDPLKDSPKYLTKKEKQLHSIVDFPKDMRAVIEALEEDNKYLSGVFPTELLVDYLNVKVKEIQKDNSTPSNFEFSNYFYK